MDDAVGTEARKDTFALLCQRGYGWPDASKSQGHTEAFKAFRQRIRGLKP
jgi:hypothetical protein